MSSAFAEAQTYCPRYPRGRLSVVKHRQLARQVGAFGEFASESSTDLDNMIFSMGSTFIFGSWICEAGDDGKLQSRLLLQTLWQVRNSTMHQVTGIESSPQPRHTTLSGDGVYRHDILSASKMIKMIKISETCMHKHMHIRHQAACMYSTRSAPKSKSAKMILHVSTLETSAS